MKAFLCEAKPHSLCSFVAPCNTCLKPGKMKMSQAAWRLVQRKKENGLAVGCGIWGLEAELERELEAEMKQKREGEGEEERIEMARFRHKCGEGKGLVELLECLEKEAIMGEDVGKEPLDYNRRAQIFDKSSRVFQALREHNSASSPQQSSQ
ncbi:uncharacterized protein LOC129302469 [Prosopis cineraria]|uniref:uncharacterized protein LOC129302469 n=1 Tax=Prosopis cineraria TaxID=364024 RepID=UPI00240F2AE8|nr:uncharacterized protein LOC129302469 [Prosopis cineraria]